MNEFIINKLLGVNRQFYQTFAVHFSDTRMYLQSGVRRILENVDRETCILDLGCGNGELALTLLRRDHQGAYTGVDFSVELLEIARRRIQQYPKTSRMPSHFIQADIVSSSWENSIPELPYSAVFAFAVLHHIPGNELRLQLLEKVHDLLKKEKRPDTRRYFVHSVWQFLRSPRLRSRIQPWEKIDLDDDDLDVNDYLLDWRQGGSGLRYIHHYNEHELNELALGSGFSISKTFSSDGEGGQLSMYQVWEPV